MVLVCSGIEITFRTRFCHFVMDVEHPVCALCSKQIRKVDGMWQRFNYEVRENGRHFLGGREVLVKRKDPRRVYGCTKCYQQLRPTPVCHESPYVKVREYCSFFIIHSLYSRHFSVKYCGSSVSFFPCLCCFYSVGQEETHCLDQCGGLRCVRQAQI